MRFTADLEIFGKVREVECLAEGCAICKVTYAGIDISSILSIRHVEEELHRQFIDYKENLKQGV